MADFSRPISSSFFVFFTVFALVLSQVVAHPRDNLIYKTCGKSREHNFSVFTENAVNAMSIITDQLPNTGYGFATVGKPPDTVYVLGQCMGDLSTDDCMLCMSQARSVLAACFPANRGRIYLDGCFLRGDTYSFYDETVTPQDVKLCGKVRNKRDGLEKTTRKVIGDLLRRAPRNHGYAIGSGNVSDTDTAVFAMANCWRSLDMEMCSSCLREASKLVLSCLPATEARALNAGCFLRYSDNSFVNSDSGDVPSPGAMMLSFIAYVVISTMAFVLPIVIGLFLGKCLYDRVNTCRRRGKTKEIERNASVFKRSLIFKYSTLVKATDSFCESNKLGRGGFGEVYKGTLADGREIAVKRLFINAKTRGSDIYNEMDIISRAQHRNLVKFLGCSLSGPETLLVYEFLSNKSLDRLLFDREGKKELEWKKRLHIIVGTAEGLEYLHKECEVRIIHRDIKASNILLDCKLRPKIADFGLARFVSGDNTHVSTAIAGTLGYMAPEYLAHGQLTQKADIYSFGVLVLEIISGIQNSKFKPIESTESLVTWAWKLYKKNSISQFIDESMEIVDEEDEVQRVVQVGLLCTQELQSMRPCTSMILQMLKHKDLQLPEPSKPPFLDESIMGFDSPLSLLQSQLSYTNSYSDFEPR